MSSATTTSRAAREGKYLAFRLGNQEYGLEILKVHEIVGATGITRVPRAPWGMRGVITVRGRVVPVISLRDRFGMPSRPETNEASIVIVESIVDGEEMQAGLLVDMVTEVVNLAAPEITHRATVNGPGAGDHVMGTGLLGDRMVVLLDADTVVAAAEVAAVMLTAC